MDSKLLRRLGLIFTGVTSLLLAFRITVQDVFGTLENRKLAEWTVMIFVNGDNNLEPDALSNFSDIAKIGSTESVNVVVQFDRNGQYAVTDPQWTQTLLAITQRVIGTF